MLLALAGSGVSAWSQSTTWQEHMSVVFPIGERDTRARVREAAIEEFRLRAARKVGSIVESSMRSDGQKLSEEIRTVGVSLVQVDEVTDKVRVDSSGLTSLEVKARVRVDEGELGRRAEAMRLDVDKIARIRKLGDQNEVLRQSIAKLTKALGAAGSAKEAARLLGEHNELIMAIDANVDKVGHTFAAGTVVDLGNDDVSRWHALVSQTEAWITEGLMRTPITARLSGVEKTSTGYVAKVNVAWKLDFNEIASAISAQLTETYIHESDWNPYMKLTRGSFKQYAKTPYSRRYFELLASTPVEIEVSIHGARVRLPVLFHADSRFFSRSCDQRINSPTLSDGSTVCIVSQRDGVAAMKGRGIDGPRNPVEIALTAEQASNATSLSVAWVMTRQDGSVQRRNAVLLNL